MIGLLFLVAVLGASFAAAWLLARRWPFAPIWKLSLFAALPVPILAWLFCLIIFVNAARTPQQDCGVDACGMTMAGAMVVAGATFLLFLFLWLVAGSGAVAARHGLAPVAHKETFE